MKKRETMLRSLRAVVFFIMLCPFVAGAQLSASFSMSTHSGCISSTSSLPVSFSDESTGSPVRWHWIFDNISPADTSNVENPSWIYSIAGNYSVKLLVYNASGVADSATNEVHVTPKPTIRFTASDTALSCPPKTITFVNHSDSGGCAPVFTWLIDTSSSIHTDTATYTFTHAGTYSITLQIQEDGCGCTNSYTDTAMIRIDSVPSVSFFTDSVLCSPPVSAIFTNNTSGAASYTWHFGDGGTDTAAAPTHSYLSPGVYTDTLIAHSSRGCASTLIKSNYVQVKSFVPGFYAAPASPICVNTTLTFRDTAAGAANDHWHFSTVASDTVNGLSTTHPTHKYTSAGTYVVHDSAWSSIGCHGVAADTIVVKSLPVITAFSVSNTYKCAPNDTVSFTSTATSAVGIASKTWYFGDTAAHAYNIAYSDSVHIYTDTGSFTPLVVVTDSNGCTARDSILRDIKIHPVKGYLRVSIDSGCIPFTAHYSFSDTPVITYYTDSIVYGDGNTVYSATGTHTYTVAGEYNILYYFHVSTGCDYIDTVTVHAGQHATYSPVIDADSVCQQTKISIAGHCTTCTSELWVTGSSSATSDSVSIELNDSGLNYVYYYPDDNGCVDTVKDSLYAYSPSASFRPAIVSCTTPLEFSFTNLSVGATNFYWNFGDTASGARNISTDSVPTHTFSSYGSFVVTMIDSTAGGHGCVDTVTFTVHPVSGPASFTASPDTTCRLTQVTFTGPVDSSGAHYKYYSWYYGDGTSSFHDTALSVHHSYSATGVFTPTLVVTGVNGCDYPGIVDSNLIHIVVPAGGVTPGPSIIGCNPYTVDFDDLDTSYSGAAVASRHWVWNFGGASVASSSATMTHTYSISPSVTSGTFHTVLTDVDIYGCTIKDTITVQVEQPLTSFTSADTSACANVAVTITDTTSNAYIGEYCWNFGDGTRDTTTTAAAAHVYTANGSYSESVVVITNGASGYGYPAGCASPVFSRTHYISIDSFISASFSLNSSFANCPPLAILATPVEDGNYHRWEFGDGTYAGYSTSMSAPTHTYGYPGNYRVTLVDSSALGCMDSTARIITILGPTGVLTISADNICPGTNVTLHLADTGSEPLDSSYYWALPVADSVIHVINTDTPSVSQVYATPGTYYPYVHIRNMAGCSLDIHTSDSVHVFAPELSISRPPLKCKYTAISIPIAGLASGYSWSPAYGLSCTSCSAPIATPSVTTVYTITGIDSNYCTDADTVTVAVDIPPLVVISAADRLCRGSSTELIPSGIAAPYNWLPADSVSCSTCDSVSVIPSISQTYLLTAVDSNHCPDSAAFSIVVDSLPVVHLSQSDTIVCTGTPVNMSVYGAATYGWLPVSGLSCDTCAVVTAVPSVTTTYTVVGTDKNGCTDTLSAYINVDLLPVTGVITADASTICVGATKLLTDTVSGGIWASVNTSAAIVNSSGLLSGIAPGSDTVKYTFTNSCGSKSAIFPITVEANPAARITTHSFPTACYSTNYQNFGTDSSEPMGITYRWQAYGGDIFATGTGSQYCLVNFPEAGTGVVTLTAERTESGCKTTDSFTVAVSGDMSPDPGLAFYGGNELVCLDNTADSYQWGYDDAETLDSTLIPGAMNQDYFIDSPDFVHKYYWVMTTHGSCLQKSYYTAPMSVGSIATPVDIELYPNPAGATVNVVVNTAALNSVVDVHVYDMEGKPVYKGSIPGGKGNIDVSEFANGLYLVVFSQQSIPIGTKTFVKEER